MLLSHGGGSGAFRSTAPATGTSQAMLGSGNPLRDGFLLCSNARMRLYKKASTVRLRLFCIIGSLAMCYSRMGKPQTTIAANVFHF